MITASASRGANLIALVSIIGVLAGIGVTFEASNRSGSIHGPLALATDGTHTYFQAGSSLYITDHAGRLQDSIPLPELGIEGDVVDMEAVGTEVYVVEGDTGHVSRCRLAARHCDTVTTAATARTFGTALDIAVDAQRSRLYVSAAARHSVDAYDLAGRHLFEISPEQRFLFPNEIVLLEDGGIAVADTNNHRIVAVSPAEGRSATLWEFSVRTDNASCGRVWPVSIKRDGDGRWWVISMDGGMKKGELLIFSSDGQPERRVDLPNGSDPINLAGTSDRMLVADFDGFRLFTVTPDSLTVEPFGDAAVLRDLEELRARQEHWTLVRKAAIAAIVLFALFGVIAVFLDSRATRKAQEQGRQIGKVNHPEQLIQARNALPPAGSDGIVWIGVDPRQKLLMKIVFFAVLGMLALQALLLAPFLADRRMLAMSLPMFLLPVAMYFFLRKMSGARIGIGKSLLHLVDVQGKRAEGPVSEAIYSNEALLLKGIMVNFRQFPKDALDRVVMPYLVEARKVGQFELVWQALKANHRRAIVILAALVFMLVSTGLLKLLA